MLMVLFILDMEKNTADKRGLHTVLYYCVGLHQLRIDEERSKFDIIHDIFVLSSQSAISNFDNSVEFNVCQIVAVVQIIC